MATAHPGGRTDIFPRQGTMSVCTDTIQFTTQGDADVVMITAEAEAAVRRSGLSEGTLTLFAPGATGALTTIEYEPGVVQDVRRALEVIAPREGAYAHNRNLGDGNGHSHVRAGLLGPSLVVPFTRGSLTLGRYQDIVFCDFDTRPRERQVVTQVMGI